MMSVLNIIIIVTKLRKNLTDSSRIYASYSKLLETHKELFQFLESLLLSIEINDHNMKRQIVLFAKFPVFDSLSGNLRDYLMSVVGRSTHR